MKKKLLIGLVLFGLTTTIALFFQNGFFKEDIEALINDPNTNEKTKKRLKEVMDTVDNVNIFISEGAGLEEIVAEMEANGGEIKELL